MKKRFFQQLIARVLFVCIILSLSTGFPTSAITSNFGSENFEKQITDISGHWAETQVNNWIKKELITGFPDGTFRPNNSITRSEFLALVNRAYGFTEKATISFSDVSVSDWFYDDVAKAVAAGYITGYGNGTVGATNNISRQEAAVIICRLMKLPEYGNKSLIEKFLDYGSISTWSKEAVNSAVVEGYMLGNTNGTFGPKNNITRAETVVTLSRATGEIYNSTGTYNQAGTIKGNATINTAGITLDGAVVEGNLYLTPGIGEGTVVLRNVRVKGVVVVDGGGEGAVVFEDCDLNKIIGSITPVILTSPGQIPPSGGSGSGGSGGVTPPATKYGLVLIGDNISSSPSAENVSENTVVTVTLTPDEGKEVDTFTVNGTDRKSQLVDNQYTFIINENTTILVTYKEISITQKSVYDILFDATGVVAGEGKDVDITLKAIEVKDEGYERVRINVEVTEKPVGATVSLIGNYGAGPVNVIALGYWGPETGHPVSRDYDMSYNLIALFSKPGQYTLAISLRDLNEDKDILTKNVTITVVEATVPTYTLTLTGDNISSVPVAGAIEENTEVTITLSPAAGKQVATFTVGGTDKKVELLAAPTHQYVFSITENTTVAVTYEDIPAGITPPVLNADSIQNYAGQTLMITFPKGWSEWANDITEISVDGEILSLLPENLQYYINPGDDAVDGQISLYGSEINALLTPGSKEIRVKSTSYYDAVVMQHITATYFERAEFTTQPVGPVENGGLLSTQPVLSLYDKYNNPCTDGPSSTREITLQKKTGSSWTLGGIATVNAINGVVAFTELTATNSSGMAITDAQLMYEVIGSPNEYFYSESFTIPGATGLIAPTLNADLTNIYAGNYIDITLPAGDWSDWLAAISAVKVDGILLSSPLQYNIGIDHLRFITDEITVMQTPGTYNITVEASGYNNAVVSQMVTAGSLNSAQFTTQPQGPYVSSGLLQQQPVVTLYDKYGNVCSNGPSSNRTVNLTRGVEDSWTLGGTTSIIAINGVATFTDLTASNPSGAQITNAKLSYTYAGPPYFNINSDYFTVPGFGSQTAPILTADIIDNYAGNIIEINFTDDPAWRNSVNSIIIGVEGGTNIQIFGAEGVSWEPGSLILDTSKIPGLQKRNIGHLISIAAPNYEATITYQPITSGLAASISIDTQPQGPATNGGNLQIAPVISLYDAYNNKCMDGPSSSVAVKVEKTDNDDWLLGGVVGRSSYQGSVEFGALSAYNLTGIEITDAMLKFTVDGTAVIVDSNTFIIPPGSAGGAAPIFTPETQYNYIGYSGGNFNINYPQNDDWTNQVINVGKLYLDGVELIKNTDYTLSSGNDQHYLYIEEPDKFFTEVRNYIIRIEAAGYTDAVIVQPITNGVPNYLIIDTQPGSPQESGELLNPQPIVKVYDKDGNLCTVMRNNFPAGTQIIADRHNNEAINLWSWGGPYYADIVNGIAAFSNLRVFTNDPDSFTQGLQILFRLNYTEITTVSEVFSVPAKKYSLSLETNPTEGGIALLDGGGSSGSFNLGAQMAVTAITNEDYAFVNWTVNGGEVSDQPSFIYTMPALDTTLVANYKSTLPLTPPYLTADTTGNYAGDRISITFPYNWDYATAIFAVEIDGTQYDNSGELSMYDFSGDSLELYAWNISKLQTQGTHTIIVKATGYLDAVVEQVLTARYIDRDSPVALISGPQHGESYSSGISLPEIKIQLMDVYGNVLTDGPDAGITLTAVIPSGYGSGSTLSGTLLAEADANGQITFSNIIVNLPEGVNEVTNMTIGFNGNSNNNNFTLYTKDSETNYSIMFTVVRPN